MKRLLRPSFMERAAKQGGLTTAAEYNAQMGKDYSGILAEAARQRKAQIKMQQERFGLASSGMVFTASASSYSTYATGNPYESNFPNAPKVEPPKPAPKPKPDPFPTAKRIIKLRD